MRLDMLLSRDIFIGLFLGRQGCGKTSAWASFAEAGNVLVYDLDRRIRGIAGCKHLPIEWLDRIEVKQPSIMEGFKKINDELEILVAKAKSRQPLPKTVVFDSASTLGDWLVWDSIRLRGVENEYRGRIRGSVNFADPGDYNYASTAFQKLFYVLLGELNCNLIFTGWVIDKYGKPRNAQGDIDPYAPSEIVGQKMLATDKMAERIPGLFDEVYFFSKEETGISKDPVRFYVEFENGLAKTAHKELRNLGRVDITNKSFYQFLKEKTMVSSKIQTT